MLRICDTILCDGFISFMASSSASQSGKETQREREGEREEVWARARQVD